MVICMVIDSFPNLSHVVQSLKSIIDPLITSLIPVTNAFIILVVVIGFCKSDLPFAIHCRLQYTVEGF